MFATLRSVCESTEMYVCMYVCMHVSFSYQIFDSYLIYNSAMCLDVGASVIYCSTLPEGEEYLKKLKKYIEHRLYPENLLIQQQQKELEMEVATYLLSLLPIQLAIESLYV